MILYGEDISDGAEISGDVCIVGSGPAGITAALTMHAQGVKVVLIDGSLDFNNRSNDNSGVKYNNNIPLYQGKSLGLLAKTEPDFLYIPTPPNAGGGWPPPNERERTYGGTGIHWGGQSRPLDKFTFENDRPGYPAWPITRADMDPYYAKAVPFCGLYGDYGADGENFSTDFWVKELGAEKPELDGFVVTMYQFMVDKYKRFQTRDDFVAMTKSADATVIRNAHLLEINHQGGSVTSLTVGSMTDNASNPQKASTFTVKAKTYVMACGAVENARQMLISGIGNGSGHLGRYVMCQPIPGSNQVVFANPASYLSPGMLNLMGGNTATNTSWRSPNGVSVQGRFVPDATLAGGSNVGTCWFWTNGGGFYFETSSDPRNTITLGSDTDPVFGQPNAEATWDLFERDENTYNVLNRAFNQAVTALGGDAVTSWDWAQVKSLMVMNGHHLGTTRMSALPTDGVVDRNLKVHEADNFYVAGSSVWTSAGISNPTFSIVAFSIRLGEHIAGQLKQV